MRLPVAVLLAVVSAWPGMGPARAQLGPSSMSVPFVAHGATTPRTLAARFGEVVNVRDYGATGDGTTDDRPAVVAAQAQAQSLGGATIRVPRGTYYLSGTV